MSDRIIDANQYAVCWKCKCPVDVSVVDTQYTVPCHSAMLFPGGCHGRRRFFVRWTADDTNVDDEPEEPEYRCGECGFGRKYLAGLNGDETLGICQNCSVFGEIVDGNKNSLQESDDEGGDNEAPRQPSHPAPTSGYEAYVQTAVANAGNDSSSDDDDDDNNNQINASGADTDASGNWCCKVCDRVRWAVDNYTPWDTAITERGGPQDGEEDSSAPNALEWCETCRDHTGNKYISN